jgi:DNA helicase-2/ATP-dependent DNA helicase PcrA
MFEAELNTPQAEAVAHVRGPLLVFAGAGSGKTRVITFRIANLVACARVPPYRILAVTFTNKAAGEMRSRLGGLLGDDIARDLWVGTFHATCAKLLRVHGGAVGVDRSFVIYDAADQKAAVTRVLKDLDYDEKRYPPRLVLSEIHKHKQEGRGPDEMAVAGYFDQAIEKVYRRYESALRASNAVDFEDLILLVDRILGSDSAEADRIRRRFDFILVDEFQDTNRTQYRFLRELAKHHRNLCVVGDDDQSIYRWRGADVRNIRGFRKDFAEATVVKLEQNYRSTKNIVSAALGVIAQSTEREPKELWTANEAGDAIEIVAAKDERDEAAHVVDVIRAAAGQGIDAKQIAVFYRIHAQSRVLEEAMRAANVPYQIIGGMRFYERAEIKDALAYLRLMVNPRSDVDVLRVVNTPARGIGSTTIDRLTAFATANDLPVFDALARLDDVGDLGAAARKKLTSFRELVDALRAEAARLPPSELLELLLASTGYQKALEAEDSAEADARLENLGELYGSLKDFEAEAEAAGQKATLEGYLERITLQSDVDEANGGAKVTLMTVHSAKGLEFELVLLTGMEEEMFPYKGVDPGEKDELEEERRLAYVAVTRARRHLVMTHVQMRQIFGTTRWGRPSRFLGDLPEGVAVQKATRAMGQRFERFIDRAQAPSPARPSGARQPARDVARREAWHHPQAGRPSAPEPGERYVDHEFFDDHSSDVHEAPLRRGSRVLHARFGEGEVRRIESVGEPAVVAFFPGWGEKKILARFLKPA